MAVLYFNWVILQKGVDGAALAGASYLGSDLQSVSQAVSIAKAYAEKNGIKDAELVQDSWFRTGAAIMPTFPVPTTTRSPLAPSVRHPVHL